MKHMLHINVVIDVFLLLEHPCVYVYISLSYVESEEICEEII